MQFTMMKIKWESPLKDDKTDINWRNEYDLVSVIL